MYAYFIPNNFFVLLIFAPEHLKSIIIATEKFILYCFLFFIRGLESQFFSIEIIHNVVTLKLKLLLLAGNG